MKLKNYIAFNNLGYLFVAAVCIVFIFQAIDFQPHDFANYYFGATFLKEGVFNSSIYFPHIFNQEIAALGYENIFVSYAPNTPALAVLFYPLSFFSLATAKIIFNCSSLFLFLYSLRNLFIAYKLKPFLLFLLPIIFLLPLRNNFLFGQVYLLLFFLLTEGFLAYKKKGYLKMSLFWSFAILLKVFPVLLIGMLLFQKKYKAILYLGISCIVLLFVSVLINGVDVWVFYLKSVLSKASNGEIAGEFVQNYQSMFMFLKHIFPSNTVVFWLLLFLFKLVLFTLSYFITKHEKSLLKLFSFWILLSILLSPYGSTYTTLLLLFPFLYFMKNRKFSTKTIIILALFFLIANVPIQYFSELPLPISFPRLLLMLVLFFILIRKNVPHINLKKSLLFSIPVFGMYWFLFSSETETNTIKSISKKHILVYDYNINKEHLHYYYWSTNGENKYNTDIQVISIDTTDVLLNNNQIFYKKKQLTFDNDNKLKPAVLNDSILIYLSDFKKGIGFYSLLKKPLNSN